MLPGGGDDPLAAVLDEVVQQEQRLVGPPPVCPVVLQHPLPEHTHGLWEGLVGEGERGHLLHLLARGTPGVVVSGVANLGLRLRVVHHDVGGLVHHLADLPHGDHGGGGGGEEGDKTKTRLWSLTTTEWLVKMERWSWTTLQLLHLAPPPLPCLH